jgi:Flp pilus assembly protein TadD
MTLNEDARLDDAVRRADELLVSSLRSEERRRARRKWILFSLLTIGAVAMIAIAISIVLFGLLGPNPTKAEADQSAKLSQEGWKLWQGRQLDDAAAKFEEAVKLNPRNSGAWNGLGWARFNSGKNDEALAAFQKVIELEPNHPAALNGLGQVLLVQKKYDEAEKYLLKAAPQAPAAQYGLAKVYLLQGKFDEAQKWAQKLVDSDQADASAQELLEAAKQKKVPDSLKATAAAPAVDSDVQQGWKLMQSGRGPEARTAFERALTKNPNDADAENGLGWYLLNSGNPKEAKAHFQRAIELDPNAAGSMNGLARVLKMEGDVDGAIKIWQEMVEKFPGPHAGVAGLAQTYLERGEFDKAVPLWEQLAKAQPNDTSIKRSLAKARAGAAKK